MINDELLPLHGGDIVAASARYEIDINKWIDLSTGMNPEPYPVELDKTSFYHLPYVRPEFTAASTAYYGSSNFIPVTGTQAAIQHIPSLLADFPVLLPSIGYQEHVNYWRRKGTAISYYNSLDKEASSAFINEALQKNPQQHVVIINPNNPTGVLFEKQQLLAWAKQLSPDAYLIVDEAFIDMTPEQSVLSQSLPDNIIVLRSFGKFFGLAGVRLGYCFATTLLLKELHNRLGLWQVNGPAQAIATKALQDTQWQVQTIEGISINGAAMKKRCQPLMNLLMNSLKNNLINNPKDNLSANKTDATGKAQEITKTQAKTQTQEKTLDLPYCFHSTLFSSYRMTYSHALAVRDFFAQAGVLLRLVELSDKQALLRFGYHDENNLIATKKLNHLFDASVDYFSKKLTIGL